MVIDEPGTDTRIVASASDCTDTMHGFRGSVGLEETSRSARLWLPQLVKDERAVLDRIWSVVSRRPVDVCPILPFPSQSPRQADELIEFYGQEFDSIWSVDARDIVYAAEDDPLDVYRTILRIDDARSRVFNAVGGAMTLLSPLGSKVLAIGAMMAAMERNVPVVYVESMGYTVDVEALCRSRGATPGEFVHVWLAGDAYASEVDFLNEGAAGAV